MTEEITHLGCELRLSDSEQIVARRCGARRYHLATYGTLALECTVRGEPMPPIAAPLYWYWGHLKKGGYIVRRFVASENERDRVGLRKVIQAYSRRNPDKATEFSALAATHMAHLLVNSAPFSGFSISLKYLFPQRALILTVVLLCLGTAHAGASDVLRAQREAAVNQARHGDVKGGLAALQLLLRQY